MSSAGPNLCSKQGQLGNEVINFAFSVIISCLEHSLVSLDGSAVTRGPKEAHSYFSYSWNHPDTFGCLGQGILGSPGAPFKHRQYNIILAKCKELHPLSLLCCGFILPSHAED